MKRKDFISKTGAAGLALSAPAVIAPLTGQIEETIEDGEIQIGTADGAFSTLARTSLTAKALRLALRSPEIAAIRVARTPGCVGLGWRYASDLGRNITEIDVRATTWASENDLIDIVRAFLRQGFMAARRLLPASYDVPITSAYQ